MRLNKLWPVVGVAAVIAPMTTLSSCATTISLDICDHLGEGERIASILRNKELIELKADKKYLIKVDTKKWTFEESLYGKGKWTIFALNVPSNKSSELIDYRVWIGNEELKFVTLDHGEWPHPGEFGYSAVNKNISALIGLLDDLKPGVKIKAEFKVPLDTRDIYVVFLPEIETE